MKLLIKPTSTGSFRKWKTVRREEKRYGALLFSSALCTAGWDWVSAFFSVDLLRIMVSRDFQESWQVIPFLSSSYVFHGFYFLTINTLFLERTFLVPLVTISSGLLNVVFNALLIPEYGIIGTGNRQYDSQYTVIFRITHPFLVCRKDDLPLVENDGIWNQFLFSVPDGI